MQRLFLYLRGMRWKNVRFLVLIVMLYVGFGHSQEKRFEPNDYGSTAKVTPNKGLDIPLDYYDFLGMPKAWYYTTGERSTILGISDALIDTTDIEFRGKAKIFKRSSFSNGHGNGVASIAAGQGDNAHAVPGVCYDCSLYGTRYGEMSTLGQLKELAEAGARVINCSWSGVTKSNQAQNTINEMYEMGTLIVASSGNKSWKETQGEKLFYPASYDKVISVSSVMYKYESPLDNVKYEANGRPYVENIRGFLSRTAGFKNDDINQTLHPYHVSTATLNEEVDILAPSVGVFRYSQFDKDLELSVEYNKATSSSAPLVSGAIGLLFSLYPCLDVEQVEPILKLTSMNIDHIAANKPYLGTYGAGILQTGDAVELVYRLYNENEVAIIDEQHFSRWDFPLIAFSKRLELKNLAFTKSSTFDVKAKQQVILKPGTHLKPNQSGYIRIAIDPNLKKECDLVLRDPSIMQD